LGRHEYWAIKDFRDDIELVLNDAMTYNKAGHPSYKAAQRIHDSARPILEELEQDAVMEIESPTSPSPSLVGDFEPLLKLVEPLFSLKAIKDESSLVLTSNPISSLINVELSALRPPPPPFPKPPKASKTPKPKRARRTELEASTAAAAVANAANDPSGTSTRRSTAIAYVGRITESTSSQGRDAWEGELRICSDSGRGKATGSHPCLPSCHTKSVQSRSLVETSSVPEFRDPVDNQLISGWILPSDQKRRTRVPTAPPSSPRSLPSSQPGAGASPSFLQPSKNKIRLDRGTSKLSVFSTVEEENQTLIVLVERRLPDLGLP
ncbi:hypothetical protein EV361DRAFT_874921, partial [Lentinula raphanica]